MVPIKQERTALAIRTQADTLLGIQHQIQRLHVFLSWPETGAEIASECLQGDTQQGFLVQCQSPQGQGAQAVTVGRREERGKSAPSGSWGKNDNYPMCWVRGREEGVRHSKRWNITKFLRRSFCTGRLGTLLWVTKTNRWLEGNLKRTKAKKQQQSCDNNPGFLNPNLVPYPRDRDALQISLRHFLSCLCSQCLTIPAVSVFQTGSLGNGPSLNLSTH